MNYSNPAMPKHTTIPEPDLMFRGNELSKNALVGLKHYGPYGPVMHSLQPIRFAVLAPTSWSSALEHFVKVLEKPCAPTSIKMYYPDYPGFSKLLRTPIAPIPNHLKIGLTNELDRWAKEGNKQKMTEYIVHQLWNVARQQVSFDVALLIIPDLWEQCLRGDGTEFHDHVKALFASTGMRTQLVPASTFNDKDRAHHMWGMSIGLYVKAGGIPWKLASYRKGEAFVGISYALKYEDLEPSPKFVTCCSQVFSSDGIGFEFVAYNTKDFVLEPDDKRNPYLSYSEMHSVLSRSLQIYQDRHNGELPKKVTVHKNTQFTEDERMGAADSIGPHAAVELVQIVHRTNWTGLNYVENTKENARSKCKIPIPHGYPVRRGTYCPIGPNEALLWIHGSVVGAAPTDPATVTYKPGPQTPIPAPVLVRRFSGDGGWHETCSAIIGLSKMDWNNSMLYQGMPVTLHYSSKFAKIIKQNENLTDSVFDFRMFM